jgi:hypothetical protein
MNNIVDNYINGLKEIYKEKKEDDIAFINRTTEEEIDLIKKHYPDVPNEFVDFLKKTNGKITINKENHAYRTTMFSIHEGDITYHLCSINSMLEHAQYKDQTLAELYPWFLDEDSDDSESATPEMDLFVPIGDRLNFASCGYSELYIDLKPSLLGKVGQIICYIHDPDSYFLVCDSFSELLKESIESNFQYFFNEHEL